MSTTDTAITNSKFVIKDSQFVIDLRKLQDAGILPKTDTVTDYLEKCTARGYNEYLKDLSHAEESLWGIIKTILKTLFFVDFKCTPWLLRQGVNNHNSLYIEEYKQ